MTDNQYIFFIGGKDLEMETIKQLLSAHNQPYIDKNLGWGAKTSAYEAEISRPPPTVKPRSSLSWSKTANCPKTP